MSYFRYTFGPFPFFLLHLVRDIINGFYSCVGKKGLLGGVLLYILYTISDRWPARRRCFLASLAVFLFFFFLLDYQRF